MPYEEAKAKIAQWNKVDRDVKHAYEYRLGLGAKEPGVIEKPMKLKNYYRQKMKGFASRQSVPQVCTFSSWDFDNMEIPRDDEGMDAEHALYFVNKKNSEGKEWKYWLKLEE